LRLVLALLLVCHVAACGPAGPLSISVGPKVALPNPFRTYPPECTEGYEKCTGECKDVVDEERRDRCNTMCGNEREDCKQRSEAAPR